MTDTVTRMAPGEAAGAETLPGWAMTVTEPAGGPDRPFDLLFVHGMASGGWIWDEAWLSAFARAGYRSWTITLPGRRGGGAAAATAETMDRVLQLAFTRGDGQAALSLLAQSFPLLPDLEGPRLEDFAAAIGTALERIGRPTAVVAHSLGGAALQTLLRQGTRPAATVLLASVPPYGLWRASMQMAWLDPALYLALMDFTVAGLHPGNVDIMRAALFPQGIADRDFDALVPKLSEESLSAMTRALGFPPFAPLPGPRPDLMVIGGALDRLVPVADSWATAAYYGGLPRIIPETGHVLMMGPTAPRTAAAILDFLETRQARG
ncbi:alpha/beta hydrolase [Mangrovicoccus algicola]|uniref:Alpha/beta fold hydrolase n=1 Tax=Mangrovicoccus algicola TaxID=2771008 RepID=A0A8J6ZA51_9RHOB|nr:alpha/beta fold hydrolase [Mangrovicoccus algicola]MBE3638921.1 alpha/beta fold hydrolase [Mangrovicoccus algicola]